MSVAFPPTCVSNPMRKPWVTAIVIVIVLVPAAAQVVSALVDAVALVALLGGVGTAAVYRNQGNQP